MLYRRFPCFSAAIVAMTALGIGGLAGGASGEEPAAWAKAHQSELVELYRYFHTHPELSFEEYETAARVAKELRAAGIEVTDGIAKTGIVGILKNGAGTTVLIRTDLDALPVTEQTGLAYASKVTLPADGSTYSPLSLADSMAVRWRSASIFLRKPCWRSVPDGSSHRAM